MTIVTASAIKTALNSAWNAGTHAKPTTPAGDGFTDDPRVSFWNCITKESGCAPTSYALTDQVFKMTMRHPTEAAILYAISLVNALTLASGIICKLITCSRVGDDFEAIIKITTSQYS